VTGETGKAFIHAVLRVARVTTCFKKYRIFNTWAILCKINSIWCSGYSET